MIKKIKLFIVPFMCLFIMLLLPINVKAELVWDPSLSGKPGYISGCKGDNYCYSMMGLRVSLYKQNGSNVTKIGRSHDYWKTRTYDDNGRYIKEQNSPMTSGHTNGSYFSSLDNDVINDKKRGIIPTTNRFTILNSEYKSWSADKVTYLGDEWKWNYVDQTTSFKNWMKSKNNAIISSLNTYDNLKLNLGLNSNEIDDLKYNKDNYFLVFETLFGVWVGPNSSLPSGFSSKNLYFVGTLFDLNAFSVKFGGLSAYANALYVEETVSTSSSTFVGNSNSYPLKKISEGDTITQTYIKSNNAIGLSVFSLNNIITIQSCLDVCSRGDLSCAENYCDKDSRNSNDKKNCIVNQCKYNRPSDLSCSSSSTRPNDKSCPNNTDSSEKTICSNPSDYYLLKCTEKTNVEYSNDLPFITDKNLGGFNYSVKLNGSKTCDLTFNYKQFEFDYAALKRNTSDRKKMEDNYPKTLNISDYGITGNDYVKIQVNNDNNFTFKLIENYDSIIKSSSSVSNSGNVSIKYYGTTKNKNFILKQSKNSSYSSLFELPKQCYSLKTGKITNSKNDMTCDEDVRNLPYYGFYVKQVKTNSNKVTTKAIVRKESSGMTNSTNACYYLIDDLNNDFDCHIEIVSGNLIDGYYTGTVKLKYVANIGRNNNGSATYKFNNITYTDINRVPQIKVTGLNSETSKKVEGYITVNGVTKACPITLNFRKVEDKSCKDIYKPVQFDAIREYCNKNWQTDVNNYSSFANCYNSCSGRDTCRTKYKCGTARITIESYCHSHYLDDGYKSYEVCVNDCICDDSKDYVYRSISLTDPFPKGREAGSNWIGFEETLIKPNSKTPSIPENTKAQYVIELDEDDIVEIRRDNDRNGGLGKKLLGYEGEYKSGVYKSKFINETFKGLFTCIDSIGRGCNG